MGNDGSPSTSVPQLPTPDQARAALVEVEQARATIATITPPLWYFVALGALIAALGPGVAVLPRSPLALLAIPAAALWAAALTLLVRAVVDRMGLIGRWDWRVARLVVVPTAVLLVTAVVTTYVFGQRWALPAFFVAEGTLVMCFGAVHVRRVGQDTR